MKVPDIIVVILTGGCSQLPWHPPGLCLGLRATVHPVSLWAGRAGTVLGATAWGAQLLARICPEMEPMQLVTGHQKVLAMMSEDQLFQESSVGRGQGGGWE